MFSYANVPIEEFVSIVRCRTRLIFSCVTRRRSVKSWISYRTRWRAFFIRVIVSDFFTASKLFYTNRINLFLYDIHSFSVARFSLVGGTNDFEQLSRRTNKSDGSWKIYEKIFDGIWESTCVEYLLIHHNVHWRALLYQQLLRDRWKIVLNDDKMSPRIEKLIFKINFENKLIPVFHWDQQSKW